MNLVCFDRNVSKYTNFSTIWNFKVKNIKISMLKRNGQLIEKPDKVLSFNWSCKIHECLKNLKNVDLYSKVLLKNIIDIF